MRALVVLGVLGAPTVAAADVRSLTRTYEYSTQPEGTTSVQLWHTARRVSGNAIDGFPDQFDYRVEVEHGLLEHWDVSVITELAQVGRGALVLDRMTLTSRYRFADRAEWPVDLAVGVEASKIIDRSIYPLALRVIAARDFDRVMLAANGVVNVRFGADVTGDFEAVFGWAAGATYAVHDRVRAGVETYGETGDSRLDGPRPEDAVRASVGPVLSVAPTSKFWISLTVGFGVTDAADDATVRGLLGIEL
jgi:hypothetical protein